MVREVPGSSFLVPVQMGHRWGVNISVIQEPNNLQYTPDLVQKRWSRAVLTALTGGCAPTEWAAPFLPAGEELQLRMVFLARCGWAVCWWQGSPAPWTHSWEGTGSQPCVCQANPALFLVQGPSLNLVLPFRKKHFSLSTPPYQYIIIL